MQEFFWKHDAAIKVVLLILFGFLALWVFVVSKNLDLVFDALNISVTSTKLPKIDSCGENCERLIDQKVAEAIATFSAGERTVVTQTSMPRQQVTYIPLNGDYSTRNTNWQDVAKSEVYIDPSEYGKDMYTDWEATIKATSGKAIVRLYDETNKIAVGSSEIESSLSTFTTVSSSPISLWGGRNLYKVQLKSLDGSEVFFNSGRIKIVSK